MNFLKKEQFFRVCCFYIYKSYCEAGVMAKQKRLAWQVVGGFSQTRSTIYTEIKTHTNSFLEEINHG